MACLPTQDWLQARIDATQSQIVLYEAAIDNLLTEAIQSYTLDTGQTRQTVTKMNLDVIQVALDVLYNRYDILCARLTGNGTINMGAAW